MDCTDMSALTDYHRSKCSFKDFPDHVIYDDAKQICEDNNSTLPNYLNEISIFTEFNDACVAARADSDNTEHDRIYTWVGGYNEDAKFYWSDGVEFTDDDLNDDIFTSDRGDVD